MNNVSLIGRFSKDPELNYTQSGKAVCNFTLAVRNPFNKDGDADFIQCVSWGAAAELIAENHEKGNMIGVDGRIQTRNYENNDGFTVWVTEVNVDSVHLIQTKDYADQQKGNGNKAAGSKGTGNKSAGNKGNKGKGNNR